MTERSLIAHAAYREAQDKFDHLVLGIVVAVVAYLIQTMKFGRIGENVETIFLVSLFILGLAAVFGFKRIESMIVGYRLNHSFLDFLEKRDSQRAALVSADLDRIAKKSVIYYRLRNTLILCGFLTYLFAKIFASYIGE